MKKPKKQEKIGCKNNNKQLCCYLCNQYNGCEIICYFLGENKTKPIEKVKVIEEVKEEQGLRCPIC
jgi:hypothetical protein